MTYVKQVEGGYEYGRIERASNRKRDKLIAVGSCATFQEAEKKAEQLRIKAAA